MANSPSNYIPNLPRVSAIVDWAYPFIGESKDRFHSWLERNNISLEAYMKEASEGGTYVHKAMEDYSLTGKCNKRKHKDIINNGIRMHKELLIVPLACELYVKCKEYQGTIDNLSYINNDENIVWLIDYKTYSLAKTKFNVEGVYKKPYSKLTKARLQLSLYVRALKKMKQWKGKEIRIAIAELNKDNYYFYPLELLPDEELEELLLLFGNSYIDQL